MTSNSIPKKCPLCSSLEIEKYWDRCWKSPDVKVYACNNCSLIFLHPMMCNKESNKYYLNYVSHLTSRGVAVNETPEQTFLRRENIGAYRIDIAKQFVNKKYNVLEIGGGCGNFIGNMIQKGLISSGVLVESCLSHLKYAANKFNLKCYVSLDEVGDNKFDAIFMFHVLEHIKEPIGFLKYCSSFLKQKGLFVVEVPSSSDPLLSLYGCDSFKDFYFQPMHHYVYSEKSLEYLFKKSGYKTSRFIYYQRYSLSNHLGWLAYGKQGNEQNFLGIIDNLMEKHYKNNLINAKHTDTIFGVFIK